MREDAGLPTAEDRQFMEQLYERHKGIMYKVASGRLSDPAEADDAVSQALLRLFRCTATLRKLNSRALVDYVATTVSNVVLDRERRRQKERRLFVSADGEDFGASPELVAPGVDEDYAERERREDRLRFLREALEELSETDRLLLVGRYLEGESEERLAARLNVKPASVRMKLTRARKRARRLIEQKEAGHETR